MNTLLLTLSLVILSVEVSSAPPLPTLKQALEKELAVAREAPNRYYLIIDLFARTITLKAGGKALFSAAILDARTAGIDVAVTSLQYRQTLSPHSKLSSQEGGRLAGRRLPLDFVGRLIEGPRKNDRLYFEPAFVIGSMRTPRPNDIPYAVVSGDDLKSLSSAIDTTTIAILLHAPLHKP